MIVCVYVLIYVSYATFQTSHDILIINRFAKLIYYLYYYVSAAKSDAVLQFPLLKWSNLVPNWAVCVRVSVPEKQ